MEDYVTLLLKKYRIAIALAVIKSKPQGMNTESYISDIKNKIREAELSKDLSNLDVGEDDFMKSDNEINISLLSQILFHDHSNDSITILKDFDDPIQGERNPKEIGEGPVQSDEMMVNNESMLTFPAFANTYPSNEMNNIPSNNLENTKMSACEDLSCSINDKDLQLKVKNKLHTDCIIEDNMQSQSILNELNIAESQETNTNFTENFTHVSQSQNYEAIKPNLIKNKRKRKSTSTENTRKKVITKAKDVYLDKKYNPNYLESQSVQIHIPKKIKPIEYTEDSNNNNTFCDTLHSRQDEIVILEDVTLTNTASKFTSQETQFSEETHYTSSMKSRMASNFGDINKKSDEKETFFPQNNEVLDLSLSNTTTQSFKSNYTRNKEPDLVLNDTQNLMSNLSSSFNLKQVVSKKVNALLDSKAETIKNFNCQINDIDTKNQTSKNRNVLNTIKEHKETIQESVFYANENKEQMNDKRNLGHIRNDSMFIDSQSSIDDLLEENLELHKQNSDNVFPIMREDTMDCAYNVFTDDNDIFENDNISKNGDKIEKNVILNIFDTGVSSDEELTDSQAEIVPYKVIGELNKIKTYLNRTDFCSDSRGSDSGYKCNSRGSFNSASQSSAWINQSSHSLFVHLSQTPLLVSTTDINYEIAKVLGTLIDRLHEEERYPTFLEEMLEFISNLLMSIYEGKSDDNMFLQNEESLDRLLLLNKSQNIINFTIEKIVKILEFFYENLEKDEIFELQNINKAENLSYIFHLLEVLLKKSSSQKMTQNSQSQDEKVLKRSTLTEIWRKKWNLTKTEIFQREEKRDILSDCSEILNKIIVKAMDGYSLVAYAALQCFNLLQS